MSDPMSGRRIAIVGGGISGLAAADELARRGADFTLFEASERLGGTLKTVRSGGFVLECGPDGWVSEKPWARELALELGLEDRLQPSLDSMRRTWLLRGRELTPLPDGMRMTIPARWGPLLDSPLLTWQAKLAYLREPKRAAELKAAAPEEDESAAEFLRRHFGEEVVRTLAAPLLAGVFGGEIGSLSARAVLPAFVRMEAENGSLILALQAAAKRAPDSSHSIFTTLAGGMESLTEALAARIPAGRMECGRPVRHVSHANGQWHVTTQEGEQSFDAVLLATPAGETARLLTALGGETASHMAGLLPRQASSAILVVLAFAQREASRMRLPRGFGFLAAQSDTQNPVDPPLLACTFAHQKFGGRAPEGGAVLRAFFGGAGAEELLDRADGDLTALAVRQLAGVLGPLPEAAVTIVQRWPRSLPLYAVGHLDRMAGFDALARTLPGLRFAGNAYRGVGIPDLIRDARAVARDLAG